MTCMQIAEQTAKGMHDAFSFEMWGGATFDVAYRFLKEDPWDRLIKIARKDSKCTLPNVVSWCKCSGV